MIWGKWKQTSELANQPPSHLICWIFHLMSVVIVVVSCQLSVLSFISWANCHLPSHFVINTAVDSVNSWTEFTLAESCIYNCLYTIQSCALVRMVFVINCTTVVKSTIKYTCDMWRLVNPFWAGQRQCLAKAHTNGSSPNQFSVDGPEISGRTHWQNVYSLSKSGEIFWRLDIWWTFGNAFGNVKVDYRHHSPMENSCALCTIHRVPKTNLLSFFRTRCTCKEPLSWWWWLVCCWFVCCTDSFTSLSAAHSHHSVDSPAPAAAASTSHPFTGSLLLTPQLRYVPAPQPRPLPGSRLLCLHRAFLTCLCWCHHWKAE